jgi:hypothetical protein
MSASPAARRARPFAAAGAMVLVVLALAAPARAERRCGWLENPTPGNWWLKDAQDLWIISTQGREPPPGADKLPIPPPGQFVATNGGYGHFCACIDGEFDAAANVTSIRFAAAQPLSVCQSDPKLPPP